MQISFYRDGRSRACTIGFNAIWQDRVAFVTNSHCTLEFGVTHGRRYFQSHYDAPTHFVGREIFDPPLNSPGAWRHSDAAVIEYSSDPHQDWEQGVIARPEGYGSTFVNPDTARFHIVGTTSHPPQENMAVHKVGIATGWQEGWVTQPCVDVTEQTFGVQLACQSIADIAGARGDSGGPVFRYYWVGNQVALAGIHVGSYMAAQSVFSGYDPIEFEAGPLWVH